MKFEEWQAEKNRKVVYQHPTPAVWLGALVIMVVSVLTGLVTLILGLRMAVPWLIRFLGGWVMDERLWWDAVDYSPRLICECELSNGEIVRGFFSMGTWEDVKGQAIYPVRWKPSNVQAVVALYKYSGGG